MVQITEKTDVYIRADEILMISRYETGKGDSNQTQRDVAEAKEQGRVFNFAGNKKATTVIYLKNGYLVLSPLGIRKLLKAFTTALRTKTYTSETEA